MVATISVLKEIVNNTEWTTAKYEFIFSVATTVDYLATYVNMTNHQHTHTYQCLLTCTSDFDRNLMDVVIQNGKYLIEMLPLEACIGNMVRRILQIIREEYTLELKNKTDETDPQESLHKILTAEDDQQIDFNVLIPSLKSALIEHINEFEAELETWLVLIIFIL